MSSMRSIGLTNKEESSNEVFFCVLQLLYGQLVRVMPSAVCNHRADAQIEGCKIISDRMQLTGLIPLSSGTSMESLILGKSLWVNPIMLSCRILKFFEAVKMSLDRFEIGRRDFCRTKGTIRIWSSTRKMIITSRLLYRRQNSNWSSPANFWRGSPTGAA